MDTLNDFGTNETDVENAAPVTGTADCDIATEDNTKPKRKFGGNLDFDRKKRVFDIFYMALIAAFVLVMWCGGFNFMPLIGVVLGTVAAVIIFIRTLMNKRVGLFMWCAYLISALGTFIFFLIWGAESFGRVLWWNLVLVMFPVALGVLILFTGKFSANNKTVKCVTALVAVLMAGTMIVYVMFMSLRLRPTVESMTAGHDAYIKSLENEKALNNSPNVLIILMDDLAYSDVSAYSYLGTENATINTPNIDSIAENGIMMDNFYASAPVCSPSRFSMLTGRYSSRGYLDNVIFPTCVDDPMYSPTHFLNPYQFLHNVDGILGDEITFADSLQALGYNTACIGKWNLGDYGQYLPTNHGFDYFYGSHYVNDMTPYNWVSERDGVVTEVRNHKENLDQSESTRLFTAEMINFISTSVDNDEKFLAYYTSPWPHFPIYSDNNGNGKGDKSDDSYVDCIEEFDRYLGDVFQTLKDKGVYDDTLIVFTSDNGPGREGVTGALRGRKNTTFDGGMKVPLVASYPNGGLGAGSAINETPLLIKNADGSIRTTSTKRIESSAMIFDVYPTVMQYVMGADYKMPTDRVIDGVSLYNLWQGDVAKDTRVLDRNGNQRSLYYQKGGKCQGVQTPVDVDGKTYDFKFYKNVHSENSAFIDQFYKNYLFNLDTDPAEGYNLSMVHPTVATKLAKQLEAFQKEMKTNRRGIL